MLAAILGDLLDFFDYYLIGFVLAFIVGPWKLTYGESAIILSGYGRSRDAVACRYADPGLAPRK